MQYAYAVLEDVYYIVASIMYARNILFKTGVSIVPTMTDKLLLSHG